MIIEDIDLYSDTLKHLINGSVPRLSSLKPSDWVEQNLIMSGGDTPRPGPYRYDNTPYCREIIDCLAPDHPARQVFVMKGQKIGVSAGVLIPAIGYIISEAPGNTYLTVPAPALIEKAMEKVDLMIDGAGLRHLIRPKVFRNKNQKTGDTNTKKDFPEGYLNITTPNNHREWRDISLKYGLMDDFDAAMGSSKSSGNTRKLIEGRFTSYEGSYKIMWVSTPLNKSTSIILPGYLLGDQRKYFIPCECCGEAIELHWSLEVDGYAAGMTWKLDNHGKLIPSSVGYVCQKCGGFFTDKNKYDFLNAGIWNPTAVAKVTDYYSYHISCLYAPTWMFGWKKYVEDWLKIHPEGQPRIEDEYKVFITTVLGLPYEEQAQKPEASAIQKNTRPYEVGEIPEVLSKKDGNGPIILLTCAADMNGIAAGQNGKVDDARLDYSIVAWSATGACYYVTHGSIGTFIPLEGSIPEDKRVDREKWSYVHGSERCVWPELDKLLEQRFKTDTGRTLPIFKTVLDSGNFTFHAYDYINRTNSEVIPIKGDKEHQFLKFAIDVPLFKQGRERADLYVLQVNLIKDKLSEYMRLNWRQGSGDQPSNFMNFPEPSEGKFGYNNFFAHFEAEERVVETTPDGRSVATKWQKRNSAVQNHMWDCAVYNIALREIIVWEYSKELKDKTLTWPEFAELCTEIFKL